MIFSSLVFLCVFLPVTYILYTVLPGVRAKNGLLIVASLLFYAYGEPVFIVLIIFSSFINYCFARLIAGAGRQKRFFLVLSLILNFEILGIFKYSAFLAETVSRLFHINLQCPEIPLPVGISFFTFQAVSYIIDVYSGKVQAQKSFWKVLLYISFFPQLIAGPIVKYRDISEAIEGRTQDAGQTAQGMRRFICGLAKKVFLANAMGMAADQIFGVNLQDINMAAAWLGAVSYMLQIYYDFSGYSDMAIGLGKMFGFSFKENFQYPYGAVSVKEFWRRWHISLSDWFKEYLYIPLGGNRKGRLRAVFNRMLVFFLTGLWHGADWTFVLWGVYHGVLLLIEEALPFMKKLPGWLAHLYTLLAVCVGFVMFRADTVSQGFYFIRQMFTGSVGGASSQSLVWSQLTPHFLVMLVVAVIGAAPIRLPADRIRSRLSREEEEPTGKGTLLQTGLYAASFLLLTWCMVRLSGSTYNPFIYFRF